MNFLTAITNYGQMCFFFQIELLMGEGALLSFAPRKRNFIVRLICGTLSCFVFGFLLMWSLYLLFPSFTSSLFLVSLFFILLWLFTYLPIWLCFNLSWKEILFVIIAGYSFQHGVYSLIEPFKSYFSLTNIQSGIIFDTLTYIPFFFLYYFVYARRVKKNCEIKNHNPNFLAFAGFLVLSADVFNVMVQFTSDFQSASNFVQMVCHFYSFLVSLSSLLLLYSFTRMNRLEQDNQVVELLLENEKKRMVQEQNNHEVINRKVHDLKHMMSILNSSLSSEEQNKEIKEINQALIDFEENIHTGNKALDSVLINRKRTCDKENISLSLIVDGEAIRFMDYVDILSLFSNILDNSIDGVLRLNDEKKRSISLKIEENLNQTFIHIENDCVSSIQFDKDNLPITSNQDKSQHGYGMKSIRYLTMKYHGYMHAYIDNGKFILNLLLPTEQQRKSTK
jgi:hypothetical protein